MPYVASTRAGLLGVEDEAVRAAAMADVQASLAAMGERALSTIASIEVDKARLEARLLAAYGALHTIEAQQVETLALAAGSLHVSPERVVAEEIALATGVGVGEVGRRLDVATAPRRFRSMVGALRAGETSLHRVLQVAAETAALPDDDVTAVAEVVLLRPGTASRCRSGRSCPGCAGRSPRPMPPVRSSAGRGRGPGVGCSAGSPRTGWAA